MKKPGRSLRELDAKFIRYEKGGDSFWTDATFADADGLMLLCPKCFETNRGPIGTHRVICNRPRVPQSPNRVGPGRWEFKGSGLDDLTLVAGSSSILLKGGCGAHFFIRSGRIAW